MAPMTPWRKDRTTPPAPQSGTPYNQTQKPFCYDTLLVRGLVSPGLYGGGYRRKLSTGRRYHKGISINY